MISFMITAINWLCMCVKTSGGPDGNAISPACS